MFIVFRAWAADFDPKQFAATYKLEGCSFWIRGESGRRGKMVHETSGFRLSLPDPETGPEAIRPIRTFIEHGKNWLDALKARGVDSEVDVGLLVGSESAFTASVTFDALLLGELARHHIALVCSAYPSND